MNLEKKAKEIANKVYVIPFKNAYGNVFREIKTISNGLSKSKALHFLDSLQQKIDNLYEDHKQICQNKSTCPHEVHYNNLFNNISELIDEIKKKKSWYQIKWVQIVGTISLIGTLIIAANNAFGLMDRINGNNVETSLLDYHSELSLHISQANQLSFFCKIQNPNQIALTKPKIQILIHGFNVPKNYKPQNTIQLLSNDNIAKWSEEDSYIVSSVFFNNKIGSAGTFTSSPGFSEKPIYPNDHILLSETSIQYPFLDSISYAIGQLDVRVLEGRRQTKYYLFQFDQYHKTNIIMETDKNGVNKLVQNFLKLKEKSL